MTVRLQKAVVEKSIPPSCGREQPHIDPSSCENCFERDDCLVESMIRSDSQKDMACKSRHPLKQGEHVFHAGEEANSIYVIRSGSVRGYLVTEEGEEQVLGFYLPGDVLGLAGVGAQGHVTSAVAMETTAVCKMPVSCLHDQQLGQGLFHLISGQLARDYNLVLMLARKDADGRIASLFLEFSEHFKRHGYSERAFNLTMRRQDIASYLGLAIETVSRTLRRFKDSGLLEISRRTVEINDLESLRAIAGTQISH